MSANIAEPLAHHARASAHKPALVHGGRVVTYGELDPLVRRTAAHLRSLDLGQGDVAGVALRDSIDHLVVLAALARAGSTATFATIASARAPPRSSGC